MGASNIAFVIKSKLTESEVESAFQNQVLNDRVENGHRSGYSGDFQTVDRVVCRFHEVFSDRDQAENYCLDNAEKWSYVIAVHYLNKDKSKTFTLVAGWGAE